MTEVIKTIQKYCLEKLGHTSTIFQEYHKLTTLDAVVRSAQSTINIKKKNYDGGGMGRYTWNILQWNRNNIKCMRMTNGDYSKCYLGLQHFLDKIPTVLGFAHLVKNMQGVLVT